MVILKKIVLYCIITCLSCLDLFGQEVQHYVILPPSDTVARYDMTTPPEALQQAAALIASWHNAGYLLAAADSTSQSAGHHITYVFRGEQYYWHEITTAALPEELQEYIILKWGQRAGKIFSVQELKALYRLIFDYAEEHQNPFAEVYFDSITIHPDHRISARIHYDPGIRFKIDSVYIHYEKNISAGFLKQYLGVYPGMPYDIRALKSLNSKIDGLPFVAVQKPWDIEFGNNGNKLNIYLKDRKANQANAIIGLQPPSGDLQPRYTLTADVQFKLYNTFGYGEMFQLSYQQFQPGSPKMYTALNWPYLLGTKWGINGHFDFIKYDSTFRKTTGQAGIQYNFSEQSAASLFYQNEGNRIITFDTVYTRTHKRLPQNLDVVKQGFGIQYQWGNLDNVRVPAKGFSTSFSAVSYTRKVLRNNATEAIDDGSGFDYSSLYTDSVLQPSVQFKLQADIQYYTTFARLITLKLAHHNGLIHNNGALYNNELFTLGGTKLLRGFNELSVFSPAYFLNVIEPRLYFGDNTYAYVFTDLAYLKFRSPDGAWGYKWMSSFGVGAQLNTSSGLFNVAFGLGKDGKNPLPSLRDTRVHIGYSIYF